MLSRSATVKLKAILIIDLIIVSAAVGAYFYLQDQGLVSGGTPKPATFVLSDLSVDPLEAYVGQPVQISANISNTGELDGNLTVDLVINNAVKDHSNLTLTANSSDIVSFTDIENLVGTYNVTIGNLNGNFTLKDAPPDTSKIVLSNMEVNPYEVWADESVNVTATANNPSNQLDMLMVKMSVDDVVVGTQLLQLDAGASQTVIFTVNASSEGRHSLKMNSLTGSFTVVKTGYHTLTISRSGGGSKSVPFTLNGQGGYGTAYTALLPDGEYSISMPDPFSVGTGVLAFSTWSDGSHSPSRTFTLDKRLILVATYQLISGYASCPSLYVWNGTGYSYVTDVSNPGWLGYIGYMNSNGDIVNVGGNPWDYVKLDSNVIATNNGYFDITLAQQWDELYYLDSAYMMVVDHPIGTDAYTSMTNYLNKGSTGQIYTVNSSSLLSPVSATNEQGQNVLSQIQKIDGVYTPGINGNANPSWNNITLNKLTLDLGNLSNAPQVKLVMTGMVDWGPADTYYAWINQFKAAATQGLVPNGTAITPMSYMEIKDANGNWIRVSQDKQIPIPSDYNARTFTVDLTGLFPADVSDYQIRLSNFWNVTYDYIAIDITPPQNVTVQQINPASAVLSQIWDTTSNSSGAFTRYGDVTPLVQNADDMFVIGRQGDQVNMQFSTANLTTPASGMVRDYFLVVACWFKDPPGAWGYGFDFTVNPMPFMAMSGFPYLSTESYPYDTAHLVYIQQYNTRIIPPP
jgi:hypothetical protein